jgi:amino acid adenylation domain-containing protein
MKTSEFESLDDELIDAVPLERVTPLSEVQSEVWLADRLGRDASLAFNESVNLRLRGPLDLNTLRAAINALVARHESLRSTVSPDGQEVLISVAAPVDIPVFDLRSQSQDEMQASLSRARSAAVSTPFDLERGPLFRVACYRLADDDHALLMTAHHIICDGWSWGVITRDLGALYAEQIGDAPHPDEAPRYSSYVEWAAKHGASAEMLEHERFWLGKFSGSVPVLELPTDRPRAPIRSFRSLRIDRTIPADLTNPLRAAGAKIGASLFATMYSGFAAALARVTLQDDLVIGVPAAGQSASDMTELVGHCVNFLPVRVAVDARQPFADFLKKTSSELLDAFEHQTMTYGTLLKKLPLQRDPSRVPLVSVMFNLDQAISRSNEVFPGLEMEFSSNPRLFENFELFVNAVQVDGGIRLECQYNTDLFDAVSIERWLDIYESLLRSALSEPSRALGSLAALSSSRRAELDRLQPKATPFPQTDLMHSAFVRQAQATPQRVALSQDNRRLTYLELEQRSNQLAQALRARGVVRGARVGLCLSRSTDMVVAVLAVLKAGGTYIPLDPHFPEVRLAYYAKDAQLSLLVTETSIAQAPRAWRPDAADRVMVLDQDTGWREQPDQALAPSANDALPEDAAYIIYTSGSTGTPKGVCVPHRSVVNFLNSMRAEPGIVADDKLAAVTTLSFDIAVLELMLPLTVGAEIVLVSRDTAMDGNQLRRLLETTGTTYMQATPGMWRNLIDAGWKGGAHVKALIGGEGLPPDLARSLVERIGELWNMYGPTETTVWSTLWKVNPTALAERGVSIGRPVANTTVWILDADRQPCAAGVPGEICIGGSGVALGYLDRLELTTDRFIPDTLSGTPGALLYRTGDRGRWRNDGLLEHLGRLDFQVKVRGYRIELGEIEAACNERPDIGQSVVLAREDHAGDVRLVAYLVRKGAAAIDEAALRSHLASRLPEYMLPQHYLVLDKLPLLPNGKVDRKALPAPDLSHRPVGAARVEPRNDMERSVLSAMESVLSLPGLSVLDDFFALGGHSLLAARLTSKLNRDFEVNLPLRTLFEARTTERMAVALAQAQASQSEKRQPIRYVANRTSAPLTPMQERVRFVEELHPGRLLYNTPSAHRLKGSLDFAKFEQALREIVRRQPSLRTYIAPNHDGTGYVQAISESNDFPFELEDLTAVPEQERETELLSRMQAIIDTPIDIYQAPLFRSKLYKLGPDHHAFLFMPHHIIWDGWSFDILYEEMAAAYGALTEGRPNPLPALPVTYGDFAQWHTEWMNGQEFSTQLQYWKDRFANSTEPKGLVPDNPRRAGMSGEGASEWVRIDKALTESLRQIATTADSTLNMLTMAVYTGMMAGVANSPSIVTGVPVRGRLSAELEPIMGFFNNLLPLQIQVDRSITVVEFTRKIKQELLEAFTHQEIPFERLAEDPAIAARAQRTGLYQALFSFQDARNRTRQWGALSQSSILVFQKGATEDLGLWLMEVPGGLEGGFTYNADLYTAETASKFRERYLELLSKLAANPGITVGGLLETTDSASAAYLTRLASVDTVEQPRVPAPAAKPRAAVSPAEQTLIRVWAELLDMKENQIASTDNFFDLGGNSLLAMRAVEQTAKALGFRVEPRRYFFESLAQLAVAEAATPAVSDAAPEPAVPAASGGLFKRVFGRKK